MKTRCVCKDKAKTGTKKAVLSPKQKAALAKGRAMLVAKYKK